MAAEYRLTATEIVIRIADNAHIPADPGNRERIEYEQWLADGGVPDPYFEPPLTRPQEAAAYLAGGLTINFTKDQPGLGTYAVGSPASDNINAIATSLALGYGFPNNASMVEVFDMTDSLHNFDNKTFPKFAQAVRDFVHNCTLYAQGEMIDLPPNSVTF